MDKFSRKTHTHASRACASMGAHVHAHTDYQLIFLYNVHLKSLAKLLHTRNERSSHDHMSKKAPFPSCSLLSFLKTYEYNVV
jgi:hypothetical protein